MTERELDMQYRLLKNFIAYMPKSYRKRNQNWVIVQDFLQLGTREGGASSSIRKCFMLGIEPDGFTLERRKNEPSTKTKQ